MAKKSSNSEILLGCLPVIIFLVIIVLVAISERPQFLLVLVFGIILLPFFLGGNKQSKKEYNLPEINAAMIGIISVVMKADGQCTKQELDEVKAFLLKRFGEQKAKKMLLLLKDFLQKEIRNIRPHCLQLNRSLTYLQRLDFLTLLFRIAEANGGICSYESEILSQIARYIAIKNSDFTELTYRFSSFYGYRKKQSEVVHCHTGSAYKVLMIEENASQEEIKKAYRRLVMLHHPDKVALHDANAQAQAAEKFQRIHEAYCSLIKEKNR